MTPDTLSALGNIAGSLSVTVLLLAVIVSLLRGDIVPGWAYRDATRQRDEAIASARKAQEAARRSVDVAGQVVERER